MAINHSRISTVVGANTLVASDTPQFELGTKAYTTDGILCVYGVADVNISAGSLGLAVAAGHFTLQSTNPEATSLYAIPLGKYGWVSKG